MRFALALPLALAALVAASNASAYCRASTCDPAGARCVPTAPDECGVVLDWKRPCIGFAMANQDSASIDVDTTRAILHRAFQAWEAVDCGGGPPSIHVEDMGAIACTTAEYNEDKGNANLVVYRNTSWPHPEGLDNIALTTVTFDTKTGEIFDADIEINAAQYHLTTSDTAVDYDLLSVLTHEAGHFLGLAHSPVDGATMFASYEPGDLGDRSLSPDDVAAICDAFPPRASTEDATCSPIPRHGFASECAVDQAVVSCAAAHPGWASRWDGVVVMGLIGAAFERIRARSRRRNREPTGSHKV